MADVWHDFIPACVGWYALYRQKDKPVGNMDFIIQRPLVGWAVYHNVPKDGVVTRVVGLTLASGERNGELTSVALYHSDTVDLVGLRWPGMTNQELDLMISVVGPGHITFAPTQRKGRG